MRALRAGRPLWLDLNSHRSANTYPLLAGHQEADVVIVGGGMTGSTIAAMFADAGVRVALVEAALIGRGSTVASTALLLREPDLGLSRSEPTIWPAACATYLAVEFGRRSRFRPYDSPPGCRLRPDRAGCCLLRRADGRGAGVKG